jgi:hypothetical protein
MARVIGGGRYLAAYTVSLSPSINIGSTPVIVITDQESTDVKWSVTQSHEITVQQLRDDQALYTFLEQYMVTGGGSDTEEVTLEDGTKLTGASTASNPLLVIVKGGGSATTGNQVYMAVAQLVDDSGSFKQEGNKYVRPKIGFKSLDPGGTVTVPATYFTSVAVTPAQATFGTGTTKYGRVVFM